MKKIKSLILLSAITTNLVFAMSSENPFTKEKLNKIAIEKLLNSSELSDQEKENWNSYNNPYVFEDIPLEDIIDTSFITKFSSLPLSGYMPHAPWTDTYWASYMGGIGYRWQPGMSVFSYSNHTKETIKNLSQEQINNLSPSEKFDLLMGDYEFTMTQAERERNNRNAQRWEGICHGWAPASLIFENPMPVRMSNPDGIEVDFNSSDIHALLSHMIAVNSNHYWAYFLGQRCYTTDSSDVSCLDANAGAFHLVLTNLIAREVPIVFDISTNAEVWNQPIYGYQITSQYKLDNLTSNAAAGTVEQIKIKLYLDYGKEKDPSYFPSTHYERIYYSYIIDLDNEGNIIGGEWLSSKRPDFLWTYGKQDFFKYETSSYYKTLEKLYVRSTKTEEKFVEVFGEYLKVGSEVQAGNYTYTVKNILTTGDIITTNDNFIRNSKYKIYVDSYYDLSIGSDVMETYNSFSVSKVSKILRNDTEVNISLENGHSYDLEYITPLVDSHGEFKVGSIVIYGTSNNISTIKYLTKNGHNILEDGSYGKTSNLTLLDNLTNDLAGLKNGDVILYDDVGRLKKASIKAMTTDKTIYLDNGTKITLDQVFEKSFSCLESNSFICENHYIIYRDSSEFRKSKIQAIGASGKIYLFDGIVLPTKTKIDEAQQCLENSNICIGDKIVYVENNNKYQDQVKYIGKSQAIYLVSDKKLSTSITKYKLAETTNAYDFEVEIGTQIVLNLELNSEELNLQTVQFILTDGSVLTEETNAPIIPERILVQEFKKFKVGQKIRNRLFERKKEGKIIYLTNDGYVYLDPKKKKKPSKWISYKDIK